MGHYVPIDLEARAGRTFNLNLMQRVEAQILAEELSHMGWPFLEELSQPVQIGVVLHPMCLYDRLIVTKPFLEERRGELIIERVQEHAGQIVPIRRVVGNETSEQPCLECR